MNLWVLHISARPYHPTLLSWHNACSDLIADKFSYRLASTTAMFFLLTIVMYKE